MSISTIIDFGFSPKILWSHPHPPRLSFRFAAVRMPGVSIMLMFSRTLFGIWTHLNLWKKYKFIYSTNTEFDLFFLKSKIRRKILWIFYASLSFFLPVEKRISKWVQVAKGLFGVHCEGIPGNDSLPWSIHEGSEAVSGWLWSHSATRKVLLYEIPVDEQVGVLVILLSDRRPTWSHM